MDMSKSNEDKGAAFLHSLGLKTKQEQEREAGWGVGQIAERNKERARQCVEDEKMEREKEEKRIRGVVMVGDDPPKRDLTEEEIRRYDPPKTAFDPEPFPGARILVTQHGKYKEQGWTAVYVADGIPVEGGDTRVFAWYEYGGMEKAYRKAVEYCQTMKWRTAGKEPKPGFRRRFKQNERHLAWRYIESRVIRLREECMQEETKKALDLVMQWVEERLGYDMNSINGE